MYARSDQYVCWFLSFAIVVNLSCASSDSSATTIKVVDSKGEPIKEAQIVIIDTGALEPIVFETDDTGSAQAELEEGHSVTVFCAHPNYGGWKRSGLRLKEKLRIRMKAAKGIGSAVIPRTLGKLPTIEGSLSASLDEIGKLQLVGDKIKLGNKHQERLAWKLKKPLKILDASDEQFELTILSIVGNSVLIDYKDDSQKEEVDRSLPGAEFLVLNQSGEPISEATVVLVHTRRNTYAKGVTSLLGKVTLSKFPNEPVVVYCGHNRYRAFRDYLQRPYGSHTIRLDQADGIGSAVFASSTGHLPGLEGRLNPILDNLGRYYLYATNIALDGGKQQPVHFKPGRPISAVDSLGVRCILVIMEIKGDTSLLEFKIQ